MPEVRHRHVGAFPEDVKAPVQYGARICAERLKPPLIELFNRSYDRILQEGFSFHEAQPPLVRAGERKCRGRQRRRTGHNFLLRLSTRKEDVLRFLIDADVPFTNNQAEPDARMMKVEQKISVGFRSEEGANIFVTIRSVISTAKKQGWNVLKTLSADPTVLIQSLRPIYKGSCWGTSDGGGTAE